MNIATGELAAMPASRDELEALNQALLERLRDAESERNQLRVRNDTLEAWAEAMPALRPDGTIPLAQFPQVVVWMGKHPTYPAKETK